MFNKALKSQDLHLRYLLMKRKVLVLKRSRKPSVLITSPTPKQSPPTVILEVNRNRSLLILISTREESQDPFRVSLPIRVTLDLEGKEEEQSHHRLLVLTLVISGILHKCTMILLLYKNEIFSGKLKVDKVKDFDNL